MSNLPWYLHPEVAVTATGITPTTSVDNTATLTADGLQTAGGQPADHASETLNIIVTGVDYTLSFTKGTSLTGTPPSVAPDTEFNYIIRVTNTSTGQGDKHANNVTITDILPAEVTFQGPLSYVSSHGDTLLPQYNSLTKTVTLVIPVLHKGDYVELTIPCKAGI